MLTPSVYWLTDWYEQEMKLIFGEITCTRLRYETVISSAVCWGSIGLESIEHTLISALLGTVYMTERNPSSNNRHFHQSILYVRSGDPHWLYTESNYIHGLNNMQLLLLWDSLPPYNPVRKPLAACSARSVTQHYWGLWIRKPLVHTLIYNWLAATLQSASAFLRSKVMMLMILCS